MPHLGPTELILILGIVIVLFGAGRIARLGGELGSGIRSFRAGLKGPEGETEVKALKGEERA
jgi:sec-independent protein translocase protein TatA